MSIKTIDKQCEQHWRALEARAERNQLPNWHDLDEAVRVDMCIDYLDSLPAVKAKALLIQFFSEYTELESQQEYIAKLTAEDAGYAY